MLSVNKIVCGRYFGLQEILNPKLLINGLNEEVKPYSLPLPINAVRTAPNDVLVLSRYRHAQRIRQ